MFGQEYVDMAGVADILHVSGTMLQRWLWDGFMPAVRTPDGALLVDRDAFKRLLAGADFNPDDPAGDRLLTVTEVAADQLVCADTVRRNVRTGQLPALQLPAGQGYRISQRRAREYFGRQLTAPDGSNAQRHLERREVALIFGVKPAQVNKWRYGGHLTGVETRVGKQRYVYPRQAVLEFLRACGFPLELEFDWQPLLSTSRVAGLLGVDRSTASRWRRLHPELVAIQTPGNRILYVASTINPPTDPR